MPGGRDQTNAVSELSDFQVFLFEVWQRGFFCTKNTPESHGQFRRKSLQGRSWKRRLRTSVNYWKNERYKTILFFKLEKRVLQITYMPCQLKNLPLSGTSFHILYLTCQVDLMPPSGVHFWSKQLGPQEEGDQKAGVNRQALTERSMLT